MPKNVRRFEWLIYLAAAAVVILMPFQGFDLPPSLIVIIAVWWSFIFTLVWLAARRRQNWARCLLFGIFVLETVAGRLLIPTQYYEARPIEGLVGFLVVSMQAAAYYFVFTGDSRDWFRKKPRAAENTLF